MKKPLKTNILFYGITIVALILLIFTSAIATSENTSDPDFWNKRRSELEVQKLEKESKLFSEEQEKRKSKLEIQKLEKEVKSISLGPWLQFLTVVIALIAAGISFYSARKSHKSQTESLKMQIQQQQKDRISDLLKELGSQNRGVKIAAIQALSEYPETHKFIANLLKYEEDSHIIDSIINSLRRAPYNSIPLIIDAANSLRQLMLSCAGELTSLGISKKDVVKVLEINNALFTSWLDSKIGKRTINRFNSKMTFLNLVKEKNIADVVDSEKAGILSRWNKLMMAYENVLQAAESVFDSAGKNKKPVIIKDAYLKGIILDNLNFSGWSFIRCDLRGASFRNAVCKKTTFSYCLIDNVSFQHTSMHDAVLYHSSCKNASFITAKLSRCSFKSCKAYNAKFYGAKADRIDFSDTKLVQAKFGDFKGTGANFSGAILKGANLSGSLINEAQIEKVDLSGANLESVIARHTKIQDSKFAGNNFKGADFRDATFADVRFEAITNFEGALFEGSSTSNIDSDKKSEPFYEYFIESSKKEYNKEEK